MSLSSRFASVHHARRARRDTTLRCISAPSDLRAADYGASAHALVVVCVLT
jgi:hypothetical protein